MTAFLPSYEPVCSAPQGSGMHQLFGDRFTYKLWADEHTWDHWVDAVHDRERYIVTPQDSLNASKFSAFVIYQQCKTENAGDGCCMVSAHHGAVCLIRDSSDTELMTFRLSHAQWRSGVMGSFVSSQADYFTALEQIGYQDPGETGPHAPLQYMDYYGCYTASANDFYCAAWQPAEDGQSPGYPRFGTAEAGIEVGMIDVTANYPISLRPVDLQGASALVAGLASAIVLLGF